MQSTRINDFIGTFQELPASRMIRETCPARPGADTHRPTIKIMGEHKDTARFSSNQDGWGFYGLETASKFTGAIKVETRLTRSDWRRTSVFSKMLLS